MGLSLKGALSEDDTPGASGSSVNDQRAQAAEARASNAKGNLIGQERKRLPMGKRHEKAGVSSDRRFLRADGPLIPEEPRRAKSRDRLLTPSDNLSGAKPTDADRGEKPILRAGLCAGRKVNLALTPRASLNTHFLLSSIGGYYTSVGWEVIQRVQFQDM